MGLAAVKTKFAVKMRTDNQLMGRGFVELYERYSEIKRESQYSLFNSRVVTSSTFFLLSHAGQDTHFHKSDLFDFGETQDLLKIWDGNFCQHYTFSKKAGYKSRYPATEQFLCLKWISHLLGEIINSQSKLETMLGLGKLLEAFYCQQPHRRFTRKPWARCNRTVLSSWQLITRSRSC